MDNPTREAAPNGRITGQYADAAVIFATSLLESANDLVAAVDTGLRIVGLNAAFRREFELVFGRTIDLGQRLDDALAHVTGDREKALALCRRVLGGEHLRVIEELGDRQLLRKTYELALSPIFDTRQQVLLAAIVMRDLTNLRQSERRFGALLEAAPDAMVIVRADGIIDLANAHAEKMFRYGRHELTGMPVENLIPERFRANHTVFRRQFFRERVARPMGRGHGGLCGLRADGTEFAVDISLSPLDVGGEPMVVGAIRDMTIRQHAEYRQRELAAVLMNLNEGVILSDPSGKVIDMNRAALEIHGFSDVAQLQRRVQDYAASFELRTLDGVLLAVEQWPMSRALRGERFADEAIEVFNRDRNSRQILSYSGTPVFDAQGKMLLAVLSVRDITEAVRAAQALRDSEKALRESEEELRATFDQAAVGIVHVSLPECRLLRVNNTFCTMLGYLPEEILGRVTQELTVPEDCAIGEEERARLIAGQITSYTVEKRAMCKNGALVWLRVTLSPVRDADGKVLYAVAVTEDITRTKQLDLARQETENRLRLAISIAHLGFWEWDIRAEEVYYSPQWKAQLGYRDDEVHNGSEEWILRLHPDDRDRVLDYIAGFLARPESDFRLEYRLRHRDDSYRWMTAKAIAFREEDGRASKLIGIQLDITETKLAEQRVLEAAQHDPLTGLPSRALVFEYASHLVAAARRNHTRGAFLFIDLDRFKPVNDLYGHETGDQLLKEVARRLLGCVRDEDLVGRLGGDEFIIVLPHLGAHRAETVAAHVLEVLSQPVRIGPLELSISASIGISYFPQHGTDVDALIHAADLAMYRTKQNGRAGFHFYSSELDSRADAAASIEAKLKRALKDNSLVLLYQPVVHMESGALLGAEALLRLDDDDGKTIGPERLIQIAESAGLINALGEWVTMEACRQHEAWLRQGLPPVTIAINVAPLQFRQRGFADTLRQCIHDSGITPSCLQIEVTEDTVMDNVDDAMETLNDIKSLGVKIALDDFGTGYSSLSHLSHLPLDKLKVDQSFVRRIETDRTSKAITHAIISLARTLDLEVVCEGVETEGALHYLKAQGCDQAQGFFISRPLPAAELRRWYRAHHA